MGWAYSLEAAVPADTNAAARKIYNIQHIYLRIGDNLVSIFAEVDLQRMDPGASLSAPAVCRLALATAFQYAESLPDPLAAQASLKRMDWKYALRLPVQHPGLDEDALCRFRQSVFASPGAREAFGALLEALARQGLFSRSDSQTLSAGLVLDNVCTITRLYWLDQAMRNALSAAASQAEGLLQRAAQPHWYEVYRTDQDSSLRLKGQSGNPLPHAEALAADAQHLLSVYEGFKKSGAARIEDIDHLNGVFHRQFQVSQGQAQWRQPGCLNCTRNCETGSSASPG